MISAIRGIASLACYLLALGNVSALLNGWDTESWGWLAFYALGGFACLYWGGHHFGEAVKREAK